MGNYAKDFRKENFSEENSWNRFRGIPNSKGGNIESIKFSTFCFTVYGTNMGYSDDGLTYLRPVFEEIIKAFPNVCFEADCECWDKWISEEYHCSYDGKEFVSEEEEW